jgi:hypothetical protein
LEFLTMMHLRQILFFSLEIPLMTTKYFAAGEATTRGK